MEELKRLPIAVVDWNLALTDPEEFARQIVPSLRTYGFAALRNHPFTPDIMQNMWRVMREVFSLPPETLNKYERPGVQRERGYTPSSIERGKGHRAADLKRFWMSRSPDGIDDPSENPHGPNVWVDEIPEFQERAEALTMLAEMIGVAVLKAMELECGLTHGSLTNLVKNANSVTRFILYDALPTGYIPKDGEARSAAHEDINILTVLPPSNVTGLRIFWEDEWWNIGDDPDITVINTGENAPKIPGLEMFKPVTHDVPIPERPEDNADRFATPHFLHSNWNKRLDPDDPETLTSVVVTNRLNEIIVEK